MNAALDSLDAQLAGIRRKLTDPCFRFRTAAEHCAATRRAVANAALEALGGEQIPEPPQAPPCDETVMAHAALFRMLKRLERQALDLRK